jgi:hypothetical protein
MEKVKKPEKLLCVCAECHKVIRTVEVPSSQKKPLISHGICPECADKLYGDFFRRQR